MRQRPIERLLFASGVVAYDAWEALSALTQRVRGLNVLYSLLLLESDESDEKLPEVSEARSLRGLAESARRCLVSPKSRDPVKGSFVGRGAPSR